MKLVDGKARVIADRLCDGLGACLGHCPRGAITVEKRDVEAFDQDAVDAQRRADASAACSTSATLSPPPHGVGDPACPTAPASGPPAGGCPGSRMMRFDRAVARSETSGDQDTQVPDSELTHWPVQLGLLPPGAPVLREARLLIAADCVPVAYAGFHSELLRGRTVVIGCPKFDDLPTYVERLAEMIRINQLREIAVARMEVPCCMGILSATLEARRRSGVDVPISEIVIGTQGSVLAQRQIPADITV